MQWLHKRELLTFEEIERLVRVMAALGVAEVRLTGGEPPSRPTCPSWWRACRACRAQPELS